MDFGRARARCEIRGHFSYTRMACFDAMQGEGEFKHLSGKLNFGHTAHGHTAYINVCIHFFC